MDSKMKMYECAIFLWGNKKKVHSLLNAFYIFVNSKNQCTYSPRDLLYEKCSNLPLKVQTNSQMTYKVI